MNQNNRSLLMFLSMIPAMQVLLMAGILIKALTEKSPLMLFAFFMSIYILPPLLWRLLGPMIPAKMGATYFGPKSEEVNGWYLSFQLQKLYNKLPYIESVLKLIPGLYSVWLRLWGANIGAGINWKSQSVVFDRPFIHIGDNCQIGNNAFLSAHTLEKNNGVYILTLKEIFIEAHTAI